jgi:hypothetical protein
MTICAGCAPVDQPESIRTVAAVEIPLRTAADRNDLVAILVRNAAAIGGIHVDDESERWREGEAQANMIAPEERGTIFVGVWRGTNDGDPEADVDDSGHPGRAWLSFARGRYPDRAARFREAVLAEVHRRWPRAQTLPVLPSGGLPLPRDLRLTKAGYAIAPAAAATYGLPPSSPLVARE